MMQPRPVGMPFTPQQAAALDATALVPDPDPRAAMKAANGLGLSKRQWSQARIERLNQFGQFMHARLVARVALVSSFNMAEHIEFAMRVAREIADDQGLTPEQRLSGAMVITKAADAHRALTTHMLDLAEKGQDRPSPTSSGRAPLAPVQLTSGGGPILVQVKSGPNGQGNPDESVRQALPAGRPPANTIKPG